MIGSTVQVGRYTAEVEGEFVVFIIGMRFNAPWKVHQWAPVVVAMPRMLRELRARPEKGLLGGRMMFGFRSVTLIQYWRSFDHLESFARARDDLHLPAWRSFNQRVGRSGDVGVYHETYRVGPGQHESIYSNMPVMGLAGAGRSVAVGASRQTAGQRLAQDQ